MDCKLNINVQTSNNMDCLDSLICTLAGYLNEDYRLMFVENWSLGYDVEDKNKKLVSDKIGTGRGQEMIYLEKYHQIKIDPLLTDENTIEDMICKNIVIDKMPMLVQVDCYETPWITACYHKVHINTHYVLIIGYDDTNQCIVVVDNQEAVNGFKCSIEEYKKFAVTPFQVTHLQEKENLDTCTILRCMLSRIKPKEYAGLPYLSIEEKYDLLINDLENNFDLFKEVGASLSNLAGARLFNIVNEIVMGRHKSAMALQYLQEQLGIHELSEAINLLNNSGAQWSQFCGVLIKSCYIKNNEKYIKHSIEKINYIKELETCAINILENYINGNRQDLQEYSTDNTVGLHDIDKSSLVFNQIDIAEYFNSNGCDGKVSADSKSELSNPLRYLICDEVKNIDINEFKIVNVDGENNDNIVCLGQTIQFDYMLNDNNYIMLLMCSEFTCLEENIRVLYGDGSSETAKIGVTACLKSEPEFNDYIVITGTPVVLLQETHEVYTYNFPGHIYGSIYKLNKVSGNITGIVLPECPNIHIFAITMAHD